VYRIIKWVKDIPYLYEQMSYRMGGSVKTQSRFLGRATEEEVRNYSNRVIAADSHRVNQTAPRPKVITTNHDALLESKINLEYYGISLQSLQGEWSAFTAHLRALGFDLSRLPKIKLRYGKTVAYKQSTLRNYYVATLPRGGKGFRTQFKTAFSHTLASMSLDLLREQRPEQYLQLASAFNQSFWGTQYALYTYILNSQDWKKRLKAFVFLWAGNSLLLEKVFPVNPQRIGLVDHSRRKDWKDEAIGLLAHIEKYRRDRTKQGFASVADEIHKQIYFARKDLQTARQAYRQCFGAPLINPYKKRAKKRLLQADARLRSQEELGRKIYLLRGIFYPDARV